MVFRKTLSGAVALLAVYAGKLTTLPSPFLLRLPGGGAAFVAAKGAGAQMTDRLLTLGWRGGLELLPALLLLRCSILLAALNGFPTLLLLRRRVFQLRFRRVSTLLGRCRLAVVTAVVAALGGLFQLRRGRLTLGIARGGVCRQVARRGGRRAALLKLGHRRLALRLTIDRRMLGRAQSAGYVGLMKALGDGIIGVWHVTAIGGVVLPVYAVARQVLSGNAVKVIHIDIDVIAVMRVIAAVVVVIVMVVVIIIIPVDAAEQRPGCNRSL